ncbi:MAG: hypothetical protein QW177_05390 [Candidatus Nitrosotenuis sp.]
MRVLYIICFIIIGVVVSYYVASAFVLQQQAINKQSVYVHLQQEWKSYPSNIVYDVTNVWTQTENRQLSAQARLQMAKETNVDELRYVHGKSYILVQHDNTNCHDVWEPHYARFGADVIRHQVEYLAGMQQSPDPNINMYTPTPSKQDKKEHEEQIKTGYSQFIPVCTDKETTNFDYAIRINDDAVGFDVYFVPSAEEKKNYDEGKNFTFYDGCFATNYARFSGTCNNVHKNAGLLIVVPDNLSVPLAKFDVWLYEK